MLTVVTLTSKVTVCPYWSVMVMVVRPAPTGVTLSTPPENLS